MEARPQSPSQQRVFRSHVTVGPAGALQLLAFDGVQVPALLSSLLATGRYTPALAP